MSTIGLVVVHGIGEPTAGDALADLTDSLEHEGIATFASEQEQRRFVDSYQSSPGRTIFFPAPIRHGTTAQGEPVLAAEVYWGSASQLAPGRLGVLQGVVSLLLNVPALVVGADERKEGLSAIVHALCWATSMLMSGPAFALNTLLLLTFAVHVGAFYVVGEPGPAIAWLVPVAAAVVMVGVSFLRWPLFPETCWSFRLIGPLILVPLAIAGTLATRTFARATAMTLEYVVAWVLFLLLASILAYGLGTAFRRLARPSTTALLSVNLQFGFWVILVPLTWQVILEVMPDTAQQSLLRVLALESTGSMYSSIKRLFSRVALSDGLQWLMFAAVALVLGVIVASRWLREKLEARTGGSRPAPRLIVHPVLAVALVAATGLGATIMTLIHVSGENAPLWVRTIIDWLPREMPLAAAVIVLVPLLAKQIRLALDLGHDVILYIHHGHERGRRVLSRHREAPRMGPVRWRFNQVVNHLVNHASVDRLVIVAHSQGTVIALDELAYSWGPGELPPISLVTCGSPISHLYGHYFPNVYPPWSEMQWDAFFQRLQRWANFYRLGDYVGTTIVPPGSGRCEFREAAIGAGAHTGYFQDPRFIAAVKEWNLFE